MLTNVGLIVLFLLNLIILVLSIITWRETSKHSSITKSFIGTTSTMFPPSGGIPPARRS